MVGNITNGFTLVIGPQNSANHPIVAPSAATSPAFTINGASVTIQSLSIKPTSASTSHGILANAAGVTISSVIINSGASASMVGISLSSWSAVLYSSVAVNAGTAVWVNGGTGSTIAYSTFTNNSNTTLAPPLAMQAASSNTIIGSYFQDFTAFGVPAASLDANSGFNSVIRSSFVASYGVSLAGAPGTTITGSAMSGLSGVALSLNGSSFTTVSNSFISAPIQIFNQSSSNTIVLSTVTQVQIYGSSATTINGCYLGGTTIVDSSTATLISKNIMSVSGIGAVIVQNGSRDIALSGNMVLPGAQRGFQFTPTPPYAGGLIAVASNTINFQSTGYGVSLTTAASGTQVWISSNMFLPDLVTGGAGNHALEFNGLTAGATVQFNSFYYRNSAGAAANSYNTIWAMSSPGLTIHHNRINQGGMITSGAYAAIQLTGSPNAGIKYNDLNIQAPVAVAQAAALVLSTGSTGAQLIGNAFNMSLAAAATATVYVDALSQSGFYANYNDYHSLIAPNAVNCAGTVFSAGGAWTCGGGLLDTNSMAFDPFWFNTAVLTEDFHPLSAAGRWNPGSNGFNADATHSLTIDSGDPNDDFSAEQAFNGNRMNIGSYAGTPEASKSVAAASFPGCPTWRNVGVGQQFASINQAVASLPPSLTGPECVIIRDGGTYIEQVTVANFTNNGSTIAIFADPGTGLVPTVSPPGGSFAAFNLTNASVTVKGLRVRPSAPTSYGVYASSPNIVLATMTVVDPAGFFGVKNVLLRSYDTLSFSTVAATAGDAVWVGGNGVLIDASSITASAGGSAAVAVAGSSNTIDRSYLSAVGSTLFLNPGSDSNRVLTSTIIVGGNGFAVDGAGSSSCTVSQSFLASTYGLASGGALSFGGNANVVSKSILVSSAANALSLGGATNTQVTLSTVSALGGSAVEIYLGATNNRFDRSTIYSSAGFGVRMSNVSSNTVSQSTITAGAGAAVQFDGGASYNVVQQSTMSTQTGL
ncbi:MAG: right-handed parallel beta-helix repeat-containing protein, partial [Elusimicrobia bacterium]|nr:right-handed parallel beta-helix repeat-containing protein [Elusimicrobiota bacterium]